MIQETKAPAGLRTIEIILGLIAVVIGFVVLVYPSLTIATITFLLGLALLFVGIFRLSWGLVARHISGSARGAAIGIGLLAIVIAILVMLYPSIAAATIVIFIAIGVLIYGFGQIVIGATSGQMSGGLRGLLIAAGVLMVILAIIVIIYPGLGITLLAVLLAIAFIIIGFESIAAGIVGVRYVPVTPMPSSSNA